MKTLWTAVKDQRGIETLEWVLIGALIVAVALIVYPGTLQTALVNAVSNVGSQIEAQSSS